MKHFLFFSLLLLIFISCNKDFSPHSFDSSFYKNLTYYESPEGVIYKLEGLKDIYSLDEKIEFKFTMINKSDTTKYHVFSYSGPVYSFISFNEKNDNVYYNMIRTPTVYDFYFEPKDTLSYSMHWDQYNITNDHYSLLKIFSGNYFIMPTHVGIPTNKIGKWIKVNEVGDPLSTKLYYYFSDQDSLKLDFLVRNRISKTLKFVLDEEYPIKIEFLNEGTGAVVKEHIPEISFDELQFEGMKNYDIFNFKISKSDSIFAGMQSSYICKITFLCNTREISAETIVLLP